jgi:hypothetical protein
MFLIFRAQRKSKNIFWERAAQHEEQEAMRRGEGVVEEPGLRPAWAG